MAIFGGNIEYVAFLLFVGLKDDFAGVTQPFRPSGVRNLVEMAFCLDCVKELPRAVLRHPHVRACASA